MNDTIDKKTNEYDGWKPEWTIKKGRKKKSQKPQTPHDFQEQHSRTEQFKLRFSQSKEVSYAHRRILDARLWDQMSAHQQEAALKIDRAYHLLSKGLGYRTSAPHLERISSSSKNDINDFQASEISLYVEWANTCTREKLSHAATIDILVFGKTCAKTDKDRKVRKGWAKTNLFDCLNEYCRMKGWPVD